MLLPCAASALTRGTKGTDILCMLTLHNLVSFFSELETYKQLSCNFSLALPPPHGPPSALTPCTATRCGGGLTNKGDLWDYPRVMFLHFSVIQLHSWPIGLFHWAFLGNWAVRPVHGWEVPGVRLLFCGVPLAGREWVFLSESRAPMTHSWSHIPKLWAGTSCSVGRCWVAEWIAEREEARATSGRQCWGLSWDCWHWDAPSVCSAEALALGLLSCEAFPKFLPPSYSIPFSTSSILYILYLPS